MGSAWGKRDAPLSSPGAEKVCSGRLLQLNLIKILPVVILL